MTRVGNERRRLVNEQEVEGRSLSLFANCEIIAGAFGSGLYNFLFLKRASRALVLVPPRLKSEKQFLTMEHVCTG